jgi:MFS transporter, DHA1 family, multidrug resistance protein
MRVRLHSRADTPPSRVLGILIAEAASSSRRPGLAFVIVLGSLTAFGPISIDMYLPGLPAMAKGFHSSASAAQLTLTACLVGLALGQLLAGPLSDRLGRRPPLLLGIAAYSVSSLLCALSPSVEVLTVLRLVQGLTGAAGIVISRAVVRDLYSGRAAAGFFSVLMLVNGLAPILAPVIGGQLLKVTSWRGVFVALAAIGAAMLLSTATVLRETLPPERRTAHGLRQTLGTMGALGRDGVFIGYALAAGLAVGSMFCYIAGSPFVLEDIYGLSPQLFSAVFAVNACGIVAASQLGRRLLRSVSPRALLYGGLAASATGGVALLCAVAVGGLGVWSVLVPLFVVVSAVGIVMPNATALALQDHPDVAGSASALVGMLQFVVGALLAPLVGVAGRQTALPMALLMAALGAGGLTAMLGLTRRRAPQALERPARASS